MGEKIPIRDLTFGDDFQRSKEEDVYEEPLKDFQRSEEKKGVPMLNLVEIEAVKPLLSRGALRIYENRVHSTAVEVNVDKKTGALAPPPPPTTHEELMLYLLSAQFKKEHAGKTLEEILDLPKGDWERRIYFVRYYAIQVELAEKPRDAAHLASLIPEKMVQYVAKVFNRLVERELITYGIFLPFSALEISPAEDGTPRAFLMCYPAVNFGVEDEHLNAAISEKGFFKEGVDAATIPSFSDKSKP